MPAQRQHKAHRRVWLPGVGWGRIPSFPLSPDWYKRGSGEKSDALQERAALQPCAAASRQAIIQLWDGKETDSVQISFKSF